MEQVHKTEESTSQQMPSKRSAMWLRNNSEFYKPMGTLLDEGYLSQDRLDWAIENAYNPH
jgi:hypothetical protein